MNCNSKKLLSDSVLTITTETESLIAPYDVAREEFQDRIFEAFGGYREFWKKIGIYLREITGDSCRFSLVKFGYDFIVLRIRKPCKYYKGIKLEDLADFFGIDLAERSEAGAKRSEASPVIFRDGLPFSLNSSQTKKSTRVARATSTAEAVSNE